MKRNPPLILICILITIAPAFGKDAWIKVQSKNFTLVGNASEGDMRKIAFKLEQFRQTLSLILPKASIEVQRVPGLTRDSSNGGETGGRGGEVVQVSD